MEPTIKEKTGPLVMQIVEVECDIAALTERLHGAQNPGNIDQYAMQLRQKQSRLAELRAQLKELRLAEKLHLEERVQQVSDAIEKEYDLLAEQDLRELRTELEKRIAQLERIISNEDAR
jgi:chromosome segregation ATPase